MHIGHRVWLVFGAALVLALTGSGPAAARNPFDGPWTVMLATDRGPCGSFHFGLQVVGGRLVAQGRSGLVLSGSVTPKGAVQGSLSSSQGAASATGRLTGNSGNGQWFSSTGACSGRWTARKGR